MSDIQRLDYDRTRDGYLFQTSAEERRGKSHPRPHMHEELEFNLVVSGHASYALPGGRYELGRGSLIWVFPEQSHHLVDFSDKFRMWVLVFNRDCVARRCVGDAELLSEGNPKGNFCRTLLDGDSRELQGLFARLKELETGSPNAFNAGLDFALALAWRAFGKASEIAASSELHPAVEKALDILNEGSDGTLKIGDLAKSCGLSASRLSRLFNRQLGVSIPQFRNQIRMRSFHKLMEAPHPPSATEAAIKAGFGSYVQFHRVFKSLSGGTPKILLKG